MSISTRRGDEGETDLLFGVRTSKAACRVVALGDVDELNAALGVLRANAVDARTKEVMHTVQPWLINLMGELATPPGEETRYTTSFGAGITHKEIEWLDEQVKSIEAIGMTFKGWVLPGAAGSKSGAFADLARAVARRAERSVTALEPPLANGLVIAFLNRLSDVLWLLARVEDSHG
ncbi:MAG: cob(I)yrinic acid a,c-diamide adenosyltransferase [Verrucomicrobiaceae bacterium]|nr:cob(I)yrinic acid a,c-diamide adenosyltransferase [Verrucomicrobiaceae bacterium]